MNVVLHGDFDALTSAMSLSAAHAATAHLALVPTWFTAQLSQGENIINCTAFDNGTIVDVNDRFTVTVMGPMDS